MSRMPEPFSAHSTGSCHFCRRAWFLRTAARFRTAPPTRWSSPTSPQSSGSTTEPPSTRSPSTIDNTGEIIGAGYAIQTWRDTLDITNSGTVQGGLAAENGAIADINNSGLWQGAADGDGVLFTGIGSQLSNTGTINATISIEAGDSVVTNSGKIDGSVVFSGSGTGDLIDNSGTILSSDPLTAVAVEFGSSSATLNNSAGGVINGPVVFVGSSDTLDNAGAISGAISLTSGADHIHNSGSISDSLEFTGSSGGDFVVNSGAIGSGVGFLGEETSETLENTATGSIAGPTSSAYAVTFSGIDGTLRNGGKIDGGVSLDDSSTLINSGSINGAIAIVSLSDTLRNSGTIADSVTITGTAGSTGDDVVTNSGAMADGISFGGLVGESLTNTSKGSITGEVTFGGDADNLQNGGTIDGAVSMANELTLVNSGSINGAVRLTSGSDTFRNSGAVSSAVALTGSGSDDVVTDTGSMADGITLSSGKEESLTITATGSVGSVSPTIAAVSFGGSEADLENGGTIGGAVDLTSGTDTVVNTGAINGNILFQEGATGADGRDSLTNLGSISGELAFFNSAGTESVTNDAAGTITGGVNLGSEGGSLFNSGKIDGGVFSSASTANDRVTNTGTISGGITFDGTQNFTNDGQIYGDVLLGSNGTMTNAGTINGSLTMGAGDTADLSPGAISGTIEASTADTFEFGGNFGDETIYNFTAGTGSTHDTIQFATNDFASFSAVRAARSQVGGDTVIRLDSADSITLVGVTATSLVSADFKFV